MKLHPSSLKLLDHYSNNIHHFLWVFFSFIKNLNHTFVIEAECAWCSCHSPGVVKGNLYERIAPVFVPANSMRPERDKATCVNVTSDGISRRHCKFNNKLINSSKKTKQQERLKHKLTVVAKPVLQLQTI